MKRFIQDEKGFKEIEESDEEESEKEESELEEELEEEEEINEIVDPGHFQEFVTQKRVGPPVLGRRLQRQHVINLEQGVEDAIIEDNNFETNGDDPFKYIPGQEKSESKYIDTGSHMNFTPVRTDVTELGKRDEREFEQGAFFVQSESWRGNNNSTNVEKYTSPERFDMANIGREDPFEREDKKYDPRRKH